MNEIKTRNDEEDSLCLMDVVEMMQKLLKRTVKGSGPVYLHPALQKINMVYHLLRP